MSGTTAGWILVIATGVAVILTIRRCRVMVLEDRRAEPARKMPASAHGVAHRLRRPPGLERDGKPLRAAERRVLDEVEWDSTWIRVPEAVYQQRGGR